MGIFLNRGNEEFKKVLNSEIYVDKTDIKYNEKQGFCPCFFYYIKNAPRGCADRGDGVNCCAIPRSR